MVKMRFSCASKAASVLLLLVLSWLVSAKKSGDVTELQISVKFMPKSCNIQAHKGDTIKVHYRGKLTDGTVFDSSFERGDPIEFELSSGQVIKGGATLIFYTELVAVNGKPSSEEKTDDSEL